MFLRVQYPAFAMVYLQHKVEELQHKVEEQVCYQFDQNRCDILGQSGNAIQRHLHQQIDNRQNCHFQASQVVCQFCFAYFYLKWIQTIP